MFCLIVKIVADVKNTPKHICNKTQEHKAIQKHPKFITDTEHDYIIYEINQREHFSMKAI